MHRSRNAAVGSLIISAGLVAAATGLASPAQADPRSDEFVDTLSSVGIAPSDPVGAIELGKSVCPMLADSGQTAADVAAEVADVGGMSLGPATLFTGIAISMFCPATMDRLGSTMPPIFALPVTS